MNRVARVERLTSETQVLVELDLDGVGVVDVTTRVPFFDHMLAQLGRHASLDLSVRASLCVALAAACWGLAIVGFGFAQTLWAALLCLALAGASDMVSGLFRSIIWNQTIPDRLRGRLAGIEMVSYTTGPLLGNAESGVVAGLFGVRASIVSGGVLCVAGTALLSLLLPELLRYDGRAGLARKRAEEATRAATLEETS